MKEGVRNDPRLPSKHPLDRQLWCWYKEGKQIKTKAIDNLSFYEQGSELDWLTHFREDKNCRPSVEPIAMERYLPGLPDRGQRSQEEMHNSFDRERMVGTMQCKTKREQRNRRLQLHESGRRIFTTLVHEAGYFSAQVCGKSYATLFQKSM